MAYTQSRICLDMGQEDWVEYIESRLNGTLPA